MLPLQITLRNVPDSPALKSRIRELSDKLVHIYDRIHRVAVILEWADKNKHHGKLFNVRIDVSVPGKNLVTTRKMDEDPFVALRDAFHAVRRQLEEHARKRHGRVKSHTDIHHGYVSRIVPEDGYGFIEGDDGHEYYFSITNVAHPTFDQIMVGDWVDYISEIAKQGWHAQHVIRKRNHVSA